MALTEALLTKSLEILNHNRRFIPGGVVSRNRRVKPEIAFARGKGAYIWDADGNRYLDYHGAFAPMLLGHNDPSVNAAVQECLENHLSLFGSGTNELEGRLAEMLCRLLPAAEKVELLNTGTEATLAAIRLARAYTGRDDIIVIQGGYNGWHNDVAANVLTPLEQIGPRVSPGEYRFVPLGPGIPNAHQRLVHVINFNDLDSVRYVCERYPIACLLTEPVLQNTGVVKPKAGYLEGLRELADRYGFVLIFDEVKTGFRYSPAGYHAKDGTRPDLAVFAKAMANGFPISAMVGTDKVMGCLADEEVGRIPFIAGTYNGHPVSVAAAIASIERLLEGGGEIHRRLERLGQQIQDGIAELLKKRGIAGVVSRTGSAFCIYFMDHEPVDWHDLADNHDFKLDLILRQSLISRGVYFFPQATKQCSISAAHSADDIDWTLQVLNECLSELPF